MVYPYDGTALATPGTQTGIQRFSERIAEQVEGEYYQKNRQTRKH